jgi:glutamate formiminotransferase/formiminotetrahydrofolate cyclodeaminase
VIEYAIRKKDNLVNLNLVDFNDELSSDSPAPGGGSVAALCSALSGSLSAMVANLTFGKKGYEKVWEEADKLAVEGQKIKLNSLIAIDRDTEAFNKMMDASRLPKKTEEDQKVRNEAMENATKEAILIPLETLEIAYQAVQLAEKIADIGNANALSDAGVAAVTANAAAKGAYLNIKINMPGVQDEKFKFDIMTKAEELLDRINTTALQVEKDVKSRV